MCQEEIFTELLVLRLTASQAVFVKVRMITSALWITHKHGFALGVALTFALSTGSQTHVCRVLEIAAKANFTKNYNKSYVIIF